MLFRSLEHLRKPSIKPSPESESIFIPANPDPDVRPMDVDVKVITADSGTDSQYPGTGPADPRATHEGPDSEDPMDIDEPMPLCMIRPPPRWEQGIMTYLESGVLPDDEVLSRQIQRRSKAYVIWQGELHRKSPTTVLERCVEPKQGERILHRSEERRVGKEC